MPPNSTCEASCLADVAVSLRHIERQEIKNLKKVSAKVNKIKHEQCGVIKGTVSADVAVNAAKEAFELLKRALCKKQTQ
ncbi:MAG: hypothetical protein U1E38_09420 [Rhodospirillales bacterium]